MNNWTTFFPPSSSDEKKKEEVIPGVNPGRPTFYQVRETIVNLNWVSHIKRSSWDPWKCELYYSVSRHEYGAHHPISIDKNECDTLLAKLKEQGYLIN